MIGTAVASVEELRTAGAIITGSHIDMSGVLRVLGDDVFLLMGERENLYLPITDPTFFDRLLSNVPCNMGGQMYPDPVSISGLLRTDGEAPVIERVICGTYGSGNYVYRF